MTPDRRTVLRAGAGLTTTLACGSSDAVSPGSGVGDRPPVGGEFSHEPNARAAVARDFGSIIHQQPRAVLKPAERGDIAAVMRWAAERGLKVAARGRGHSTYGRALAEDGVVIDMSSLDTIHHIRSDHVLVDAGATWRSVFEATLARGLTPPVLTNYLGLSVGGTLTVGGIGGASSRHGMQTDHVLELEVTTGDGRELTCSPESNPDLFGAVRGGLSQCGIITRARLRLVRAPERVRRFQLFYPDMASLVADQRRVLAESRFDQLQGALLPDTTGGWRYQLEGALFYSGAAPEEHAVLASLSDIRSAAVVSDLTYHDDSLAFDRLEAMLRSKGQWANPQPWLLTFLRGDNAERLASEILAELSGHDVGPFGRVTLYPLSTSAFRSPMVRLPDDDVVFPFNLVRIPASIGEEATAQTVAQNRKIYDRVRKEGGLLYPVSALPMTTDDWKEHFGPNWQPLRDARRRYDPDNLLTPGYNVFERDESR